MISRPIIALVCIAALTIAQPPVRAEADTSPTVAPLLEMSLKDLQLVLIGRLLWALGKIKEQDQPACNVSGPVYSPKWPYEHALTEPAPCFDWRHKIDDALRQYDHDLWPIRDFSRTWDSLRSRVLQDADASYRLCHREVSQDDWCKNAVALYKPLAEKGNVEAQFRVGIAFSHMMPSPSINPQQDAIMWLRRAAERDYVDAELELANQYYLRGLGWKAEKEMLGGDWVQIQQSLHFPADGAAQDLVEAITWWKRAAESGSAISQWRLSLQYETGEGVRQDYVQAYKWLTLAIRNIPTDQRHHWWADHRQALAAKMTPQQTTEARRLVGEWLQQHSQLPHK